ncbi:gamma-glutamyl-gamma-aminobutyrate hydrolase family protein [Oceanobacillus damuensis]|uniref:gamma-glutamyl-gamma-aminobutyrate hydrolase family protein n=1 Tax=Oceanobacillus damuensis TaxID=937928 RepID=UPI00082CCA04|nr:gamma-glutamyl-gamma-aminobutyrate hydrolase family protein [Oceanobacillus damuensis]
MKKIIGITTDIKNEKLLTTGLDNIKSIVKSGAVPVVLPNLDDEDSINQLAELIDGLLVTGGGDIDPTLFGEEPHPNLGEICPDRDRFEMLLITKLLELDKPILAICRGCQILNLATGGDMHQDIYAQSQRPLLQHYQKAPRTHTSHYIDVTENSFYQKIVQATRFKVNSYHHQAVRKIGDGFEVCAKSSDGIIEAFESKKHRFVIGIQWHPENLFQNEDIFSLILFKYFVYSIDN